LSTCRVLMPTEIGLVIPVGRMGCPLVPPAAGAEALVYQNSGYDTKEHCRAQKQGIAAGVPGTAATWVAQAGMPAARALGYGGCTSCGCVCAASMANENSPSCRAKKGLSGSPHGPLGILLGTQFPFTNWAWYIRGIGSGGRRERRSCSEPPAPPACTCAAGASSL
jgi:hypothetical protein